MGHGIDTNRDFQYGIEIAWHSLTKLVKKLKKEMFPGLETRVLHYQNGGQNWHPSEFGIAIASDDHQPCGKAFNPATYSLFQPQEAWDYVESVLSGTDYVVESLGMLKDRSLWFISTRLKELESVKIKGDSSETKFQFNFSGGLDRQFSPQADLNAIRIVCTNTLSASRMSGETLFKIKCTKNFKPKLESTKTEVEKAVGMARIFTETMSELNAQPCDSTKAERIYAGFLAPKDAEKLSTRSRNTVDELTTLFRSGMGNRGASLYDVLNGFTELRTRGAADSGKSRLSQFESSEFGLYAQHKAEFATMLSNEANREETAERGRVLLAL